jgi:hypothetical protein
MPNPQFPDDAEDGAGAAPLTSASDGRLVLTPALRITDGTGGTTAAEADDPPQPDDAALRALVREILREELAGPFGERITRGVRKLVRTEVATLLAACDRD